MLVYEPSKRISWKEIHNHDVVKKHQDMGKFEKDANAFNINQSIYMPRDQVNKFYDNR